VGTRLRGGSWAASIFQAACLTEHQATRAAPPPPPHPHRQRSDELKKEEAARRARDARWFEAGKDYYARGEYPDSVKAFERSVEENGREGVVGGDSLMWLALAYQAVGREQDCIDT
jgi:hypothetical protein